MGAWHSIVVLLLTMIVLTGCRSADASTGSRIHLPISSHERIGPSPTSINSPVSGIATATADQSATSTATSYPELDFLAGQSVDAFGQQDTQLRVEIKRAERRPSLPYKGTTVVANGRFMVLLADIRNDGKQPDTIATAAIALVDPLGRRFTLATDSSPHRAAAEVYGREPRFTTVQPGISLRSVLVFDVDPDAELFMLVGPATPTPSRTATVTRVPTSTRTPVVASTLTPTLEQTLTVFPSATPTLTFTSTRTLTSTPTLTLTSTRTPTSTRILTPTQTPADTSTSTRTATLEPTLTIEPSPTVTITQTITAIPTPTSSATSTRTSTPTRTETSTRTPTDTKTPSQTATERPTSTLTPTEEPTVTPSTTRTATRTLTPTRTPTPIPTHTSTPFEG